MTLRRFALLMWVAPFECKTFATLAAAYLDGFLIRTEYRPSSMC